MQMVARTAHLFMIDKTLRRQRARQFYAVQCPTRPESLRLLVRTADLAPEGILLYLRSRDTTIRQPLMR